LTFGANRHAADLPLVEPSLGPPMVDVRGLYQAAGAYTFDPGFTATGSCRSKITYVDGERGILLYRGYPIDQLVEHSDYLEVCYLLLNGELPTAQQKQQFHRDITYHTMVHEQLLAFYRGFRRDAHPMAHRPRCPRRRRSAPRGRWRRNRLLSQHAIGPVAERVIGSRRLRRNPAPSGVAKALTSPRSGSTRLMPASASVPSPLTKYTAANPIAVITAN
jgi:hypothetical protein